MKLLKWNDIPEFMKNNKVKKYYEILEKKKVSLFFKRVFDIFFSLLLLIILSPILLIFAILIKLDSKGPIFYRQERITQYGRKFRIFKFRTMVVDADKGSKITTKDDKRITRIGKIIRKIRLDEIPQLLNVFVGEMTFVGTRPEVNKYVIEYTDEMKATLLLPAGITSNASICFKDEDKIIEKYMSKYKSIDKVYVEKALPEKMKYNLIDIEKFSFFREIGICFKTVYKVFF